MEGTEFFIESQEEPFKLLQELYFKYMGRRLNKIIIVTE